MRLSGLRAWFAPGFVVAVLAVLAALHPAPAAAIPPTLAASGRGKAEADLRTLVVRLPKSVRRGDFLIVGVVTTGSAEAIKPPGWYLLRRDDVAAASGARAMTQRVFYRFADAPGARFYVWQFSKRTSAAAGLLVYRGVERSAPIHDHTGKTGVGAGSIATPRMRTTTPDVLLVGFFGKVGLHAAKPGPSTKRRFQIGRKGPPGVSITATDRVAPRPARYRTNVATTPARTRAIGQLIGLTPDSKRDTYYVAPTGIDSGPGTRARPWKSLQRALDVVHPGHRVIVRAGTYVGPLELRRSGAPGAPVTMEAFEGERPVIAGRLKVSADHATITGFTFDGAVAPTPDVLLWVDGGDDVEIRRNEVKGATQTAIFVGSRADPAERVRIIGNWIHDNGTRPTLDEGVHLEYSRGGLIGNNVIERSTGFGIECFPDADDTTVIHNTIVSNGRSGVILAGSAAATSDRNVIANNIVGFNSELGIRTSWSAVLGTGNAARRNITYLNVQGDFGQGTYGAGLLVDPNNRAIDPQFADLSKGNYRLASTSPARDQALATLSLAADIDGRPRPAGAGPDIGAYEGG